jgi:hypothetical protein
MKNVIKRISIKENKINKNWNEFIFNLDNMELDKTNLRLALNQFWEMVMKKSNDDEKVGLILRVKFKNNSIKSYSLLQTFG